MTIDLDRIVKRRTNPWISFSYGLTLLSLLALFLSLAWRCHG